MQDGKPAPPNRDIIKDCVGVEDLLTIPVKLVIGKTKHWLCKTCQGYMMRNRMPPMCQNNKLSINHEPKLERLTRLENSLIAREINFMFIHELPVSRMWCQKGKVTLVPIEEEAIKATVEAPKRLPRTFQEGGLVTVRLKKKLEYQATVGRPELVNVRHLEEAQRTLQEAGNPHYGDVFDKKDAYERRLQKEDPRGFALLHPGMEEGAWNDDDDEPGDEDLGGQEEERFDPQKDPVKRNQHVSEDNDTCMVANNPEVQRSIEDAVIDVAPGEGRRPHGMLLTRDWDILSHPRLHNADGSDGLHQEGRPVKLTDQQYFKQRLLNSNRKYAQDPSYVFAAAIHTTKKQINGNMGLSFTTGKKVIGDGGKVKYSQHDAWSVLSGIKNTPRFWREKKGELIAMMDNFGAFHWFFTLSLADKRWKEILAAICREFPDVDSIIYSKNRDGSNLIKVKVKGREGEMSLEDYMENCVDESKNEIIKRNVQLITRCFDQRVKSFVKNIIMGPGNKMKIILYSYRVEFQKRGHAHVHGCLWSDIDSMDKDIPNLKAAYANLRNYKPLTKGQVEALVIFTDMFVTCSLSRAKVGAKAAERAEDVQTHGHSRRCKKKPPDCWFGFPKFPCDRTLIARPEVTDKKEFEKAKIKLKKVKEILEDEQMVKHIMEEHPMKEDATVEEYETTRKVRIKALVDMAGIEYEEYHSYLEMNIKSVQVVLQRDISEIYINNFNPEWLEIWDANHDLAPVKDFFGVITYVTEYAFKPESYELAIRKDLEACKDEDVQTKMKVIAASFQDNRQMGEAEACYQVHRCHDFEIY